MKNKAESFEELSRWFVLHFDEDFEIYVQELPSRSCTLGRVQYGITFLSNCVHTQNVGVKIISDIYWVPRNTDIL